MVQMAERFKYIRPDEVAECWDGVLSHGNLYETLWGFVERYTDPRPEVSEEPIVGGNDTVSRFWNELTEEQQVHLNKLAEQEDAHYA